MTAAASRAADAGEALADANVRSAGQPSIARIVLVCSGAMIIASVDRINISVAILAMQKTFAWSDSLKGFVMAAFFVGYLGTQVAGGWLAHRIGGERVLLGSLVIWSLCTMLTPVAAHLWFPLLICARVALGMSEGPCNPAVYNMFGRWVDGPSRTVAVAVYGSAGFLGCFIALLATGPLVVRFGWESAFYVCGAIGLAFGLLTYPLLSRLWRRRDAEDGFVPGARSRSASPIPWAKLLGLRAFWALVVALFCTAWVYYVLMLWMPSYFQRAFGLDISRSGFLSLAPWLIMFVVMNVAGVASAALVRRGMSETLVRKLFAVGGLAGTGAFLMMVQTATTPVGAMLLLCAALGSLAVTYASLAPNVFDLAPRYGEVLFSVLNTFGALPGIVGVSLTGLLVEVTGSFDAALIASGVLAIVGAAVFLGFGSARRQVD